MLRKYARKVACVVGVAIALALFLPKLALADEDDPPSVVARLAFSQGSVSFQPAGTEDWVDAGINRPITTGDKFRRPRRARRTTTGRVDHPIISQHRFLISQSER